MTKILSQSPHGPEEENSEMNVESNVESEVLAFWPGTAELGGWLV